MFKFFQKNTIFNKKIISLCFFFNVIDHKSTVTCCRFAPMENRICTTSMDRTTKIIDMQTFTEDYNVTLTLG